MRDSKETWVPWYSTAVTQKQFVMASDVSFGGENFTFQNKWNDPCLISGTALGDEHLQGIHEDLENK